MKFWKMNGTGNDFIIIDNRESSLSAEALPDLARQLCRQHWSIGADGLMVVEDPVQGGDIAMRFYNADGSVGEMCGNGARCLCRYCFEKDIAGSVQRIETMAGMVEGERVDKREYRIRLNDPNRIKLHETATIGGQEIAYSYVELGDPGIPHIAVEIKGLREKGKEELFELGRKLRYYPDFPRGTNVNFYDLMGPDRLFERTWERGVEGFTYACGTGTASVVTLLTLLGRVSGKGVSVDMEGGRLTVDVCLEEDKVRDLFLAGPTNLVAIGEIFDEDLVL